MKRIPQRPLTLTEVATVLEQHGITPGGDGYAWADLMTVATQRGWHVRVEPDDTPSLGHHSRALVWSDGQFSGGRNLVRLSAKGRGTTDEEALAEALARLLIRQREADQTPR